MAKGFNPRINLFVVIMFMVCSIGLLWLYYANTDAAGKYITLLVLGIIWFTIAMLYIKDKYHGYRVYYPVEDDNSLAVRNFVIGLVSIIVLLGASQVFHFSFFSSQNTVPLASFKLVTFQSDWWYVFIVGIVAPVAEEVVLGLFFVVGSLLFGFLLLEALKVKIGNNSKLPIVIAVLLSTILFAALHYFNNSYLNADGSINIAAFSSAALFRIILNTIIYLNVGFLSTLGIGFSIGVHMGNNMMALGLAVVASALFTTWQGIVFVGIVAILIFAALVNYKKNGRGYAS